MTSPLVNNTAQRTFRNRRSNLWPSKYKLPCCKLKHTTHLISMFCFSRETNPLSRCGLSSTLATGTRRYSVESDGRFDNIIYYSTILSDYRCIWWEWQCFCSGKVRWRWEVDALTSLLLSIRIYLRFGGNEKCHHRYHFHIAIGLSSLCDRALRESWIQSALMFEEVVSFNTSR